MRLLISGSWVRAPRWATSFCRVHSKDLATDGNVFRKHFNPIRPQGVLFTIPLSRSTASLLRQFNICWFLKLNIFALPAKPRNLKKSSHKERILQISCSFQVLYSGCQNCRFLSLSCHFWILSVVYSIFWMLWKSELPTLLQFAQVNTVY